MYKLREEYPWRTSGHPPSQRPRKIETKRHKEKHYKNILYFLSVPKTQIDDYIQKKKI